MAVNQAQVTEDYYATLGVAPKSEAVEIRAAYLALMRRFHPDKNDSPAAIERAHAIIAAFAVLGNVEKRLNYDWGRRRAAEAAARSPRRWGGKLPRALLAAALGLLLLVPLSLIWFPVTRSDPPAAPTAPRIVVKNEPIQITNEVAIVEPPAPVAPVSVPERSKMVEPAPVEPTAVEPRPSMNVAPLVRIPPPQVFPPRQRRQARNDVRWTRPPASAKVECRFARPGAEAAICNNDGLATLDRSVVTFFNQSLQFGVGAKRAALLGSREGFLARREECRSDDCLQRVHLTHLRELSAIVENRPPEPPR